MSGLEGQELVGFDPILFATAARRERSAAIWSRTKFWSVKYKCWIRTACYTASPTMTPTKSEFELERHGSSVGSQYRAFRRSSGQPQPRFFSSARQSDEAASYARTAEDANGSQAS